MVRERHLQSATTLAGGPGAPGDLTFYNQTYGYDIFSRLTSVTDSGYTRNFAYDGVGNMSVTASSGVPLSGLTPYSGDGSNPFNYKNQLNSGTYDNAGNQTQLGSLNITYDADNHQTSVQDGTNPALTYGYDGDGRRVVKSVPGFGTTVYAYDIFGKLAAEYSDGAARNAPCRTCYLTVDHLGSTRLVTDQAGSVVSRHDYLPFGEEIPSGFAGRNASFGATDSVNQEFTGQERDSETTPQLDFFQARYLSAAIGKFTSPDPENTGSDPGDPQSWNSYAYGRNNPVVFTDPTGRNYTVCDQQGENCGDLTNAQYNDFLNSNPNITASPGGQLTYFNGDGSYTNIGSGSYYDEQAQAGNLAGAQVLYYQTLPVVNGLGVATGQ